MNMVNPFFELPNQNPVTCHVFSLDNTPSNVKYSMSAFAQKIRNLCWMLKSAGHRVIYYGYESCDVECDEKIIVGSEEVIKQIYSNLDKELASPDVQGAEYVKQRWTLNTCYELKKRYKQGDFFFWMMPGFGQRQLYYETFNWPVNHIESSIGYLGAFLPYRVFESIYIRDYHHGCYHSNRYHYEQLDEDIKEQASQQLHYLYTHGDYETPSRSDIVIPGYFDISLFDFKVNKHDYLLYLGRIFINKGISEAVEIAERLQMKLIVAGPGDFESVVGKKPSKYIEVIGTAGPEKRRELISNAKAVFSLTHINETFGCVPVEAMLSGTVPITSDSGGFLDTIRNGYNGYRIDYCDIQAGVDAVKKIEQIDPYNLRNTGLCYSREKIALQYDAYIQYICKNSLENLPRPSIQRGWESEDIQWPDEWMTPIDVESKLTN